MLSHLLHPQTTWAVSKTMPVPSKPRGCLAQGRFCPFQDSCGNTSMATGKVWHHSFHPQGNAATGFLRHALTAMLVQSLARLSLATKQQTPLKMLPTLRRAPVAQVCRARPHPRDPQTSPRTPHKPEAPTCDASPGLSCPRAGQKLLLSKKGKLLLLLPPPA